LTVILKKSEAGICYGIFSLRKGSTAYPCEPSVTDTILHSKDNYLVHLMGTAAAQWLRYCATNQKVFGSIPDGVMEFFIDINPSDRLSL
jgi:hypothetical protein